MKKYTLLQKKLAETLNKSPDDQLVTDVIEATAVWFEYLLENMGIIPSAIPTLLRWQYFHTDYQKELEERCDDPKWLRFTNRPISVAVASSVLSWQLHLPRMTDSTKGLVRACMYCEHHFSNEIGDFCKLHCIATKNYVRGVIIETPMLCSYARSDDYDYCGPDAKDYVHRGPEKKPGVWYHIKNFISMFF